nr:hypothetical protein [Mycoplasmopsis bovis]
MYWQSWICSDINNWYRLWELIKTHQFITLFSNDDDTVKAVKNLYYKYDVKLINMSLGPTSIFDSSRYKDLGNSNSHISSNKYNGVEYWK